MEEVAETDENSKSKMKNKKSEERGISNSKLNELRALESYIAKTNANASNKNTYFNMLTGNEEVAQIYAYILQNFTKSVYKEIIKFRKRTNYLKFLTVLMQKALNEELNNEINEWSLETIDWLQKRNASILGKQLTTNKKIDGFMALANKPAAFDLENEVGFSGPNKKKRKKSRKYKLLIPLDLDLSEKIKLEERQKKGYRHIERFIFR